MDKWIRGLLLALISISAVCLWIDAFGAPVKSVVAGKKDSSGNGASKPYDAEVEYLQSTGTQWIDTGVYMNGLDSVEIKIRRTSAVDCGVFGSRVGYTNNQYMLRVESNGLFDFYYNNNSAVEYWSLALDADYSIEVGNGKIFINGSNVKTYPDGSFALVNKCHVFKANQYPSLFRGRIYYFRIDEKIDLIPVRFTNEQGGSEGAMFDRVSGQLFRNQGTGDFVIGPDKQGE